MKNSDRINELVDELNELKLFNMASALDSLYGSGPFNVLDNVTLLEKIIEPEYENKTSQRFLNRLKRAHLAGGPQSIDKCQDSAERSYLPPDITTTLSSMFFIQEGLNVCILGPSDSGKSYLARALGIQACLKHRVMYHHCEEFLETMVALKQADYTKYKKKVRYYLNLDLLILDDFLLHTITDEREIKVLFEVMEKRSELSRCTIVCSQREPNSWASMILNDEVSANANSNLKTAFWGVRYALHSVRSETHRSPLGSAECTSHVENRLSYAIKYPSVSRTCFAYLTSFSSTFLISSSLSFSLRNNSNSRSERYL